MTTFVGIPQLSPEQLNTPQMATIEALRQNVNLLIGDANSGNSAAVTRDSISVETESMNTTSMKATGAAYALQGVNLASGDDYRNLITDVASLYKDVYQLYSMVNQLITDMKG